MWQESDGAVGDLLTSRALGGVGLIDDPIRVSSCRMYQFGQLIDSLRWKWLHAEASLYREGRKQVGFDDIAERRAHLAGWTK